jgi:threonine aldolase
MRQAGVIAAAALYALDHHIERLAEDHENAQILADGVRASRGLELNPTDVDTNIVIFRVDSQLGTAADFVARLNSHGVAMYAIGPQLVRAVTHLDVSHSDVQCAAEVVRQLANEGQRT